MESLRAASERAHAQPWYQPLPALLPMLVAMISLLSLLLLVQSSGVTTTGYDARRLEQEKNDWYAKNYQLEAEIAGLQSLDRIEQEAKGRLKMVPASSRIFVQANKLPDASLKSDELPPSHIKEKTRNTDSSNWFENLIDSLLSWRGQGID